MPVVAVGVAAPAFAVSPGSSPQVVPGNSVKCPGSGGNNFNFKAVLAVSTVGDANWRFHIVSWTFDGVAGTNPADVTLTGGDGNLVLVVNRNNSAAKHVVAVTYQATNLSTNEVVNGSFPSTELTFGPQPIAPITCP
jgi:hypothetical protein